MSNPDFWRRFLRQEPIPDKASSDFWKRLMEEPVVNRHYDREVYDDLIVATHPHNNCPVCHPAEKPQTIDAELEVLVSCMRTSAQDTLINLHKAGYHIVKA